jgi:hypothetical protein
MRVCGSVWNITVESFCYRCLLLGFHTFHYELLKRACKQISIASIQFKNSMITIFINYIKGCRFSK